MKMEVPNSASVTVAPTAMAAASGKPNTLSAAATAANPTAFKSLPISPPTTRGALRA